VSGEGAIAPRHADCGDHAGTRLRLTPDQDRAMLERRTDWLKRAQFDEVKTQISERLPNLRNRIAGDEFNQIVRGLTLVRLKCELNRIPQLPMARPETEVVRH
jgi:hypothetical protein